MTNPDANAAREESILSRRSSRLGLGLVTVAFLLCAALTWRKWPDLLVDYGTQLYIPWRILNGAVLYRDLFYFGGGPLAQYFNAVLFKIFGVSFSTLIFANLIFTAGMVLLVFRRFLAAADAWTATLIGTAIVVVFAFAEYTAIGNYNYITPYSYEATYGLMLSICALAVLTDWINSKKICYAMAAGFCAGLVLLTKPDIFMALAITVTAAFVVFWLKHGAKDFFKSLGMFVAGWVLPPLFFIVYFLRAGNLQESMRLTFFDWIALGQSDVTKSPFYQWCLGLDQPLFHVREILVYFAAIVLVLGIYAFALRRMKDLPWIKSPYIALLVLMLPVLLWAVRFDWVMCGWPLPLLCLSACVLMLGNYKQLDAPQIFPLLWSVFGLALLAKLGLLPRVWHYGFALAMPAFVSSIYLLFRLLPTLLEEKFGVPAGQFRIVVGVMLLIGLASLFDQSQLIYERKKLPLGTGGDEIITYLPTDANQGEKSQAIYAAVLWTEKYMPPDATLAILPEGVTLNYLTRHVNPTGGLDWNPTMFTVFGQDKMTAAVENHAPDYIFLIEWDSSEFKVGYFGSTPEYGQALMDWIHKNYKTQVLIGNEPLKDGRFGIKILKRITPAAQAQSGGFNASKSAMSLADK
ncbi:MAG TPA: hypothetical protein VK811_05310 [Candidatus Acidoferrum sp.]|nr:hypothetical protein [Candidatus Acidoferrum sp.]